MGPDYQKWRVYNLMYQKARIDSEVCSREVNGTCSLLSGHRNKTLNHNFKIQLVIKSDKTVDSSPAHFPSPFSTCLQVKHLLKHASDYDYRMETQGLFQSI